MPDELGRNRPFGFPMVVPTRKAQNGEQGQKANCSAGHCLSWCKLKNNMNHRQPMEGLFSIRRISSVEFPAVRMPRATNKADHYDSNRYTKEIHIGVDAAIKAGAITADERWASHQLRHRAGTGRKGTIRIGCRPASIGAF